MIALGERTAAEAEVIARAGAEARRRGAPVLASVTLPAPTLDPLEVYARAKAHTDRIAYFEQPARGPAIVAAGEAWRCEPSGERRFAEAAARWRELSATAVTNDRRGLIATGGFAFAAGVRGEEWREFRDGALAVPEATYRRDGGRATLTRNRLVTPDGAVSSDDRLAELASRDGAIDTARATAMPEPRVEDDGPDAWRDAVEAILRSIEAGNVEKVVLARRMRATAPEPLDDVRVLASLRRGFPGCTTFAFRRGDATFAGASPERLTRVADGRVHASSLAGSARRGRDADEDARLGEALLRDAKERHEHALVAAALREGLAPVCRTLDAAEAPELMRMANVQHLHTPITGELHAGTSALDVAGRLHPTPAVGGAPREAALRLIAEHERFARGWYAGPAGWIDANGDGEFIVALRSGLLRGREALLYAGCGIVAASDPAREHEESMLKLRPMLCAIRGS
jgi:isochorismate synthase